MENGKIPNIQPWNGTQTKDSSKIPWYFISEDYNSNYLNEWDEAIINKTPYSWVRLGDSEHFVLQHLTSVLPITKISSKVTWASGTGYCGATLPNADLKRRLVDAVENANLVGVFKGDPELEKALKINNLNPKSICYAYDSIALPMNPQFCTMLVKNKCLLVGGGIHGTNAETYSRYVKEKLKVDMEYVTNIKEYKDIEKCKEEIYKKDFDICLISAGVNAKIICNEMKQIKPALYLDIGHAFDNAIAPNYKEYWLLDREQLNID